MAVCSHCGDPVVWRHNDRTRTKAPVNLDPDPHGNILLVGVNEYHVLTKVELERIENPGMFDAPSPKRYVLHFTKKECAEAFRNRDSIKHKTPRGTHGRRN